MTKKISQIGEFGLIEKIQKMFPPESGVVKGVGDDTAVIKADRKKYWLFTTDMLAENTHFTRKMDPEGIGHKSLACSISDIAAMGGVPKYAVISMGLPPQLPVQFVRKLYLGIKQLATRYAVAVVGGDTIKSRHVMINVALLGEVNKRHLVTRAGARKGDWLFTTGPLGRSLASNKHLKFFPRVRQAHYLVKYFHPSAMIDISDGLAADLTHIMQQSRLGAILYEEQIPKSPGATLQQALYDGEDFELLFCLSPDRAKKLLAGKNKKMNFLHIGEMTDQKKQLILRNKNGKLKRITIKGYRHF